MSASRPSRLMERGIVLLFVAAAAAIGLGLLSPAVSQAVEAISGHAVFSLLTSTEVPLVAPTEGLSVSATFDSARVSAHGLEGGTVALLVAGMLAGGLSLALTAGSIALFFLLLLWGRPFHRALVAATLTAGSALLIGGVLSAGLGGLGRMMAADELNALYGDVFVVGFSFDPAPLFAGLATLALSLVFERGARMQRDTEGLV